MDETQLRNIDEAIVNVKMDTNTHEAEDRVWNLYANFIEALENGGYNGRNDTHTHIYIKHIVNRIQNASLKYRMKDIERIRKADKLEGKDFGEYIRELDRQAKQWTKRDC